MFSEKYKKRIFDISTSVIGLAVFAVPIVCAAALSAVHFRKNPFILVNRSGRYGTPFKMIKIRSMTDEKDENGKLLPDEVRRTWFGKLLRKTSVDELPQLINILLGHMSAVGPRPTDISELKEIPPDQKLIIFSIKPGLTGPWQIKAIGNPQQSTMQERRSIDQNYAQQPFSPKRDFQIITRSVPSFWTGHDGECFRSKKDKRAPNI